MSSLLTYRRYSQSIFGTLKVFLRCNNVQRCTSAILLGTDSAYYLKYSKHHTSALPVTIRHYTSQNVHDRGQNVKPNTDRSVFYPVIGVSALLATVLGLRWYLGRPPSDWKSKDRMDSHMTNVSSNDLDEDTTDLQSVSRSGLLDHGKTAALHDTPSIDHGEPVTTLPPTSDASHPEEAETLPKSQTELPENQRTTTHLLPLDAEDSELPPLVYKDESKLGFPSHVPYLIIGAGTAGLAAARSIRAADTNAKVLMISGGSDHFLVGEPGIAETDFVEPPPYLRPPLSKELWRRDKTREVNILRTDGDIRRHSWLYYEAESFYLKPEDLPAAEYGGVALLRGDPVAKLDPDTHTATLISGRSITYDRCLLATGGRPKRLKQLEICETTGKNLLEFGLVSYFRSLADYKRLRDLADKLRETGGKIAVVGGGFLGSELTVSLLTRPKPPKNKSKEPEKQEEIPKHAETDEQKLSVLHVFRESLPMGHNLPPCLASATARFEEMRGARIWPSSEVVCVSTVPVAASVNVSNETAVVGTSPGLRTATASDRPPEKVRLRIRQNGFSGDRVEEIDVDHVVLAIGIEPNTDLSDHAGLEIDQKNGGFLVNAEMEARAGIYAAGDAASYWDPVLGYRRRVEHLNFAEETGALAGKNMATSLSPANNDANRSRVPARYQYQSSFWSSLGPDVSWDAVGYIDSRKLLTRSFFLWDKDEEHANTGRFPSLGDSIPDSEFGHLGRGVVFYLTPSEKRLVGILLWNLPEEIYSDKEYTAPSRLNIARYLLARKHVIGKTPLIDPLDGVFESEEEQLRHLASYFDMPGVLEQDYAEIKSYAEARKQEILANSPSPSGEQEPANPVSN